MARFSLRRWWQQRRPGPWYVGIVVEEADDVPESMAPHEATLVRSLGVSKWLVFSCPCGTGHRIMLNLDRARWPSWTVASEAPLTVWPSVDLRSGGRQCHYVVHRGRVNWVLGIDEPRAAAYDGTGRMR